MKNTRSRRPDQVRVIGADLCEAPNPQPEAIWTDLDFDLP